MRFQVMMFLGVALIALTFVPLTFAAMDGLVGAWLFDEGTGDIAADSSDNGLDGTLMGNADWEKQGKFNSAIVVDGTEAYVEVPDTETLEFDGDFTIACWVWNETLPGNHSAFVTKGYHTIPANGGDARPWYLMYYRNTGTVDMFLRDQNGTNSDVMGVTPINDGEWHHVVGMKDGDEVKIYIDGNEDGVVPAVDAVYGDNDLPLVFMVHYDRWFPGMIDEVAIFDRALSDAEIEMLMGGLLANVLAVEPSHKLATTWAGLRIE